MFVYVDELSENIVEVLIHVDVDNIIRTFKPTSFNKLRDDLGMMVTVHTVLAHALLTQLGKAEYIGNNLNKANTENNDEIILAGELYSTTKVFKFFKRL